MGPNLGFMFVIIVASNKIFFVSGIGMKLGIFHYVHRHTELKNCADKVLKEMGITGSRVTALLVTRQTLVTALSVIESDIPIYNNNQMTESYIIIIIHNLCVGGRVQELTGRCECLSHSWGLKQTIQAGYAYTKKVSVEENFIPPVNFKERKAYGWILPGVLREGAKVEITISSDTGLTILLLDYLDELVEYALHRHNYVSVSYDPGILGHFQEFDGNSNQWLQIDETKLNFTTAEKTKISFMAMSGSLWVLADDQTIFGKNVTLDLTTVRQIAVINPYELLPTLIHSFKFIDA